VAEPTFIELGWPVSGPVPGAPAAGPVEQRFVAAPVLDVHGDGLAGRSDQLAVEEPLEIRLRFGPAGRRAQKSISITMRTPGHDPELAAGFLLGEGIVHDREEIESLRPCGPPAGPLRLQNVVRVDLRPDVHLDLDRLERHFYTTSSCGVCGKASLEALRLGACPSLPRDRPAVRARVIHQLPEKLRASQAVFDRTGGLHAAALFDAEGNLLCLREDVGRHNAVDKLVGAQLLARALPASARLLLVSGRASFELLQKALMAGIPVLAAVGAPSSLAVDLATRFQMTLLGFVRDDRFNIYSGAWRVAGRPAQE
jgi:FdhD protein